MEETKNTTIEIENLEPKQTLHHLPCSIDFNGKANVQQYFLNTVQEQSTNDDVLYSASIRGRPMKGRKVDLPTHQLKGFVLVEKNEKEHDEEMEGDEQTSKQYVTKESFSTIMNWSLDSDPKTYEKQINGTVELQRIMNAFHEPLPL